MAEFELAGLTFGHGTPIVVTDFVPGGKPDADVQDQRRPRADGIAFGRDFLGGRVLTFEFTIDTETARDARARWGELSRAWDAARDVPGLALPLRVNPDGGTDTRVTYGRPRKLEPASLQLLDVGRIDLVADFQAADHLWYSDEQQSLMVSGVAIQHRNAVNLIRNPSFETGTHDWSPTGATLATSTTFAQSGSQSLEITPDGGVDATVNHFTIPVTAGGTYTSAYYVFTPTALSVPLRLRTTWFDDMGGFLAVTTHDTVTDATAPIRLSGTAAAPDGAVTASCQLDYDGLPTSSDVSYVDAALFVESPELIDYFDGDDDSAFWTGTPHNSTSQLLSGGVTVPTVPPVTLSETFVQSTLVHNDGNADTWPVFVIRGPRHQPRVRYVDGEVEFWLDTTLARDQTVTVDPRPWSRRVTRNDGANLAGAMRGTRLSVITLPPGDTEFAFRGTDDTGLSSLTVQWRDAHASL